MTDQDWMKLAIKQAEKASAIFEVPVGAVLIKDDKLIAQAHNQPISTSDPSAHAEIQLLRTAGKKLGNYRLKNTTLYVSLEPCAMCFGAMIHARIARLVFGSTDPKSGVCGSCANWTNHPCFNHKIQIQGGILSNECSALLTTFFQNRRLF